LEWYRRRLDPLVEFVADLFVEAEPGNSEKRGPVKGSPAGLYDESVIRQLGDTAPGDTARNPVLLASLGRDGQVAVVAALILTKQEVEGPSRRLGHHIQRRSVIEVGRTLE
jgi:hypothetical protein